MKWIVPWLLASVLLPACAEIKMKRTYDNPDNLMEDLKAFTGQYEEETSSGSAMAYADNSIDEDDDEDEDFGGEDSWQGISRLVQRDEISKRGGGPDYSLMSFEDLLKTSTDTVVQSNFGKLVCTFQAKFKDCLAQFLPVEGMCNELPSLSSFMLRFFPGVDILKASSNFLHPDKFDIEGFTINRCEAKTITFQFYSPESVRAVERYLVVNNVKIEVVMPFNDPKLSLASFAINGVASTTISGLSVPIRISKQQNSTTIGFDADDIEKVMLSDLAKKFHFSIDDLVGHDMGPARKVMTLDKLAMSKAMLKGYLSKGQAFEFVVKGTVIDNPLFQEATHVYLIVQKYTSETKQPKVAIYAKYEKPLLGMLRALSMDQELPSISLYSAVKDFVFTVASDEFLVVNINPAKNLSMEYTSARFMMPMINPGLELRFKVPNFRGILKRQYSPAPDNNFNIVTVNMTDDMLRIHFPDDVMGPVPALVKHVWDHPNLQADKLPLPDDVMVRLVGARFSLSRPLFVNITFMITSTYVVVPGLLTLNGVYFKISTLGTSPDEFTAWRIYSAEQRPTSNGTIDVEFVEENDLFFARGSIETESLKDIETTTSAMMMPDNYRNMFAQILEAPVKDVVFESQLGKEKKDFVRILGTALLLEGREVDMDGLFKLTQTRNLAMGLHFKHYALHDILELLTGNATLQACWLKFTDAGFMFSKNDIEGSRLKSLPLQQKAIVQGASFIGTLETTIGSCSTDALCKFLHRFISANIQTTMTGSISPDDGFTFRGKISENWQICDSIAMTENELVASGMDEESSFVALEGKLAIKELDFKFKVSVSMKDKGRLMIMAEEKLVWPAPLGFATAKLADVKLMHDLDTTERPKFLRFEGVLHYGTVNGKELKGETVLIYDLTENKQHYFYGKMDRLSLKEYAASTGIVLKHGILLELKFNSTVEFDYTTAKKGLYVSEAGRSFWPSKFSVEGKADVLGNYTMCSVQDKEYGFRLKCIFPKIEFDGGAIVARKGERHSGPRFIAKISPTKNNAALKGRFSALGITDLNNLVFNSDGSAEIVIKGKFNDLIDGTFTLSTKYGPLSTMKFQIESMISEGAKREVVEGIHEYVEGLKKFIKEGRDKMEEKKKKASDSYGYISVENEKIKELLQGIENNVYRKSLVIEKHKDRIKRNCVPECGSACYYGVTWNPRCTKVRNHFYGCTGWSGCSSKAANTPCIARCEAEKVANTIEAYDENANVRGLIDDYQEGKVKMNRNDKLLMEAKRIKNHLAETQRMIDLNEGIINEAINLTDHENQQDHPISIMQLKISGTFNKLNKILYPFHVQARVGEKTVSFSKDMPVESDIFVKLGELIVKGALPKLEYLEDNLGAIITKHGVLDRMVADFIKVATKKTDEEEFLEANPDSETRDYIPSDVEERLYAVATDPIPMYITHGEETRLAFSEDSPWVISARHQVETGAGSASYQTMNDTVTTGDPCSDISNVMNGYGDIMKGMNDVMDHHESANNGLESREMSVVHEAETLKQNLVDIGKRMDAHDCEINDMVYWANEVQEGARKWVMSNKRHLERQDQQGLGLFAAQLNEAIKKEGNTDLQGYLQALKERGTEAMSKEPDHAKRSAMPVASLHQVHEGISGMLSKQMTLSKAKGKLAMLRHHMGLVRRSTEYCR